MVEPTHLKNISQCGSFPQIEVKIKKKWNHHLEYFHGPLQFVSSKKDYIITFEKSFKPHQKSCATLAPISCSGSSLRCFVEFVGLKLSQRQSAWVQLEIGWLCNPLEKGGENLENSRCCYSQVIISINWKPPKPATGKPKKLVQYIFSRNFHLKN